ncbi:MAG: hypothetical protein AB8G22_16920 [Saprospiraceae bacterium]
MRATYLNILLGFAVIWIVGGCISQKKYDELRLVKEYYEQEAESADSISGEYRSLYDKLRQQESDLKMTYRDIEQLTATNISLNNSYQQLLQRYNEAVGHSKDVVQTYGYEKQQYDEKLSAQQEQLAGRGTTNTPSNYNQRNTQQRLDAANRRITELVQQVEAQAAQIRALQSRR